MVRILVLAWALVVPAVYATDWYVKPLGGSYGSENGTSEANAFDGRADMAASAASINAGDTIHICNADASTFHKEGFYLAKSGSSGSNIRFTGEGCTHGGTIDLGIYALGVSGDWTDAGSNVWTRSVSGVNDSHTTVDAVWFSNLAQTDRKLGILDATPDAYGEWSWTDATETLSVYSVGNPTGYYAEIIVPGMEAGAAITNRVLGVNYDFQTWDNLTVQHQMVFSTSGVVQLRQCQDCIMHDITVRRVGDCGLELIGDSTGSMDVYNMNVSQWSRWDDNQGLTCGALIGGGVDVTLRDSVFDGKSTQVDGTDVYRGTGIRIINNPSPTPAIVGLYILRNTIQYVRAYGVFFNYFTPNQGLLDLDAWIQGNTIAFGRPTDDDSDGVGMGSDVENASNRFIGVHIRGNTIHDFRNTGIHFANYSGDRSDAIGNLIYDVDTCSACGLGGIRCRNGATCSNNTIYNTQQANGIRNDGHLVANKQTTISNNLISNVTQYGIRCITNALPPCIGSNNLVYSAPSGNTLNFANDNGVYADPLFTNAAADDYTLQSGSPAINAGISYSDCAYHDLTACDATPDIGAYQFTAAGGGTPGAGGAGGMFIDLWKDEGPSLVKKRVAYTDLSRLRFENQAIH